MWRSVLERLRTVWTDGLDGCGRAVAVRLADGLEQQPADCLDGPLPLWRSVLERLRSVQQRVWRYAWRTVWTVHYSCGSRSVAGMS